MIACVGWGGRGYAFCEVNPVRILTKMLEQSQCNWRTVGTWPSSPIVAELKWILHLLGIRVYVIVSVWWICI